MATVARVAAGLCGLVVVLGGITIAAGIAKARLAEIQLGVDAARVQEILRDRTVASAVRRAMTIDYAFLTAYWAAFVTLAVLVLHRGGAWAALGGAAAVTATATAGLDVTENLKTTGLLGGEGVTQPRLDALRRVSLAKWSASSLTVALLAAVYARHGWWSAAPIAAFLLVAALGFAGLFRHRLIQRFLGALGLIALVTAILLQACPKIAI